MLRSPMESGRMTRWQQPAVSESESPQKKTGTEGRLS